MPEIFQAIVLGIVQGLTEFIPVSSSGHLVIVPWLLGWDPPPLVFDTILHWGTLTAILLVFWRDFWDMIIAALRSIASRSLADPDARLAWLIVLASIPVVVIGLAFKDFFERLFVSEDAAPLVAGVFLLVTAALLIGSELLARSMTEPRKLGGLRVSDAVIIGLAQAVALFPGISRSGSTIAAGLARRIRRDEAARFSFLMGAPVFFGAGLLQISETMAADGGQLSGHAPALVAGFLAAAITGVLAIRFLLNYLRTRSLYAFAIYCIVVGLAVIGLSMAGYGG